MHEIRIPRLGWSMEEGSFIGWLKQPGDQVAVGEALFELEGEKALQEIESVDAGTLVLAPGSPPAGTVVPVGMLLGYLLAPGEVLPSAADSTPSIASEKWEGEAPAEPQSPQISGSAGASPSPSEAPPARPSVRRIARELGVNLNDITGTGEAGQVTREDVLRTLKSETADKPKTPSSPLKSTWSTIPSCSQNEEIEHVTPIATPRAKRVARELEVNWTLLRGTGRDGRIREADVMAAVRRTGSVSTSAGASPKLRGRRKAIADRLRISRDQTIPVTLTSTADATNLVALREQFKATSSRIVPAFTDIVACLVARVLKQHPHAVHRDEVSAASANLSIGIAVDTPAGLLVPVVSDVLSKSLLQVAEETNALIERARQGRLTALDMQGGCFTISNLGAFGIDGFTPIINYPEIAILGLGAIRREAVVLPDDRIVPRDRITLSLTFDHAAIDGAPAAALLRDIVSTLENPAASLLAE